MKECFNAICSAIDNARIKFKDMESELFYFQGEVERLLSAINRIDSERERLEAENRTLQEKVRELEKALVEVVKIEVSLPECAVCWERDQCTDRSHGDNCLAVGYVVDMAKEAAKGLEGE